MKQKVITIGKMTFMVRQALLVFIMLNVSCAQEVKTVRAVRGREALLPCGPDRITLDGPQSYIMWLKDDKIQYRYPDPEHEKLRGTETYIQDTVCETGLCRDDTWLTIQNVTPSDEGHYRCRIRFQASPAMDYAYDLEIVEPTGVPKIYLGDELITEGIAGPFPLGSKVTLKCEVEGKDTQTTVYWTREGGSAPLTKQCSQLGTKRRVDLHLHALTRDDLGTKYECVSQNADITAPLVARVLIKMYFAPLSVEIRMDENRFEVGHPRVVDCVVVGCSPPPVISWYLGEKKLQQSVHKELHDGNYTVSSLTLVPSGEDNGTELVCRVHNSHLPENEFEDRVTLNVGSRPICHFNQTVRMGIVPGEPEWVKCVVTASPKPDRFSWTFPDGHILYTNFSKVIDNGISNKYTATLHLVPKDADIGLLICRADNVMGEQERGCTFNMSIGGPPDQPNCKVQRVHPNTLKAKCAKGWDGGRPQMYHLNLVDEDGTPLRNISSTGGLFEITNMRYNVNVTAVIYTSNVRGQSPKRIIKVQNLRVMTGAESNHIPSRWTPYIEGITSVLVMGFGILFMLVFCKILRNVRPPTRDINLDIIPDGAFHREPDVVREERPLGRSNVALNELPACEIHFPSTPLPKCRLLLGPPPLPRHHLCPPNQHTYYV